MLETIISVSIFSDSFSQVDLRIIYKYSWSISKKTEILIKIKQCHYLDRTFLQNRTTDFDETLHVAWVCLCEGFGNSGRSGYSPLQKKSGRRPL